MNVIAEIPENSNSDMAADEAAEPMISLDATSSIQNIFKLYERLKRSYSMFDSIDINASQVASIDTATLQLLVALKKEAARQEKKVVIVEPSPRFIESAELLGLSQILELSASV